MAEKKKLVSEITSMDVDFAQWYTDIVKKAEMADYSSVKGCIIMRPYAQAVGKSRPVRSCAAVSSCGRRSTPFMLPPRRLWKRLCAC